jgi:hypothetical protein
VFGGGYNSPVSYVYDQNVIIAAGCLIYADKGERHAE